MTTLAGIPGDIIAPYSENSQQKTIEITPYAHLVRIRGLLSYLKDYVLVIIENNSQPLTFELKTLRTALKDFGFMQCKKNCKPHMITLLGN